MCSLTKLITLKFLCRKLETKMANEPITVEQMKEYAPGPWKWRTENPEDLPEGIKLFIRRKIEES